MQGQFSLKSFLVYDMNTISWILLSNFIRICVQILSLSLEYQFCTMEDMTVQLSNKKLGACLNGCLTLSGPEGGGGGEG